jgi:hypothetical protein
MTPKLSQEYVVEYLKSFGYHLEDEQEYKNNHEKMTIVDGNGYKYSIDFCAFKNSIIGGWKPLMVAKSNPYSLDNIKKWIKDTNAPFQYVSGEFVDTEEKNIFLVCKNCHEIWYTCWNYIGNGGSGCPSLECKKMRIEGNGRTIRLSETNNLEYSFPELLDEWDYSKNKLKPSDYCPRSGKKAWWKCLSCGHGWFAVIGSRTKGIGCPNCKLSKGEARVERFLIDNLFLYDTQYSIDECRNKNPLPFDFVVFIKEEKILIEYQGEQHYSVRLKNNFFGGEEDFKIQQKRDKIKKEYCRKNNIDLIIIPYWDYENIEEILSMRLTKYMEEIKYDTDQRITIRRKRQSKGLRNVSRLLEYLPVYE